MPAMAFFCLEIKSAVVAWYELENNTRTCQWTCMCACLCLCIYMCVWVWFSRVSVGWDKRAVISVSNLRGEWMIHKKGPQMYRINRLERKREEIRQAEVALERTRDGWMEERKMNENQESRNKWQGEDREERWRVFTPCHIVSHSIITHTHTHIHTLLSTALNQSNDISLDGSHYIPLTFGHHTNDYWKRTHTGTHTHKIFLAFSCLSRWEIYLYTR